MPLPLDFDTIQGRQKIEYASDMLADAVDGKQ
jgi:hypothetical protein